MAHVQDDGDPQQTNHRRLNHLHDHGQPLAIHITQGRKANDKDGQAANEDIGVTTVLNKLVHVEEENQDQEQTRVAHGIGIGKGPAQVAVDAAPEGAKEYRNQRQDEDLGTVASNGGHGHHQHASLRMPPPFRRTERHLRGAQQDNGSQDKAHNEDDQSGQSCILVGFILEEEKVQRREEHHIANGAPHILPAHLAPALGGLTHGDHDGGVQEGQSSHGEDVAQQADGCVAHKGVLDTASGL